MTAILLKIILNRLISREARSELGLRQVLGLRVGKKIFKNRLLSNFKGHKFIQNSALRILI